MESEGSLVRPIKLQVRLAWLAAIGNLHFNPELNAGQIADEMSRFFGGEARRLTENAFVPADHPLSTADEVRIEQLQSADLVLMSAAPWHSGSGLYVRSGMRPGHVYPLFGEACGTVGGVFVNADGSRVQSDWRMVGLDYADLQSAAAHGNVVLVCGGRERRRVLLAALRGKLTSNLVTSSDTARWLLSEAPDESTGTTYARVLVDILEVGNGATRGVVRSWNSELSITIPMSSFPQEVQAVLHSRNGPTFLLAMVNLAAETADELDPHGFQLAPELGPEDELIPFA
jgi:hypothetical protein